RPARPPRSRRSPTSWSPRGSPTSPSIPTPAMRRSSSSVPGTCSPWRSPTTAWAERTRPGRACPGWRRGPRAWTGGSGGPARPRGGGGGEGAVGVVIAEDSVLLREGLARLLAEAGHEVVAAAGEAEEFLRDVGEHQPDVVVVDVRMPPTFTDEGLRAALVVRST